MESTVSNFSHLQIPLEDVLEATNNFNENNVIGHRGLGKVYKGKLLRSGKWVKISARRLNSKHKQGIEFLTEISVLSSLNHHFMVPIIGFCDEKGEKVIINKYVAKGSLEMHLSKPTLTWVQRLNICIGIAHALSYVHYRRIRSYSVIHRNINSSTILLNNKFEPKLSGFEYSIQRSVHEMDQVLITEATSTKGYVDPSIENTGGVTYKSDIYAFGVVLYELLFMRKAFIPYEFDRFLAPLVRFHYENNTVDVIRSILFDQIGQKSLFTFLSVAYSCTNDERAQRPDMTQIVIELKKALLLQLEYERLYRPNLERLTSEHSHMKIRLADICLATDNFSQKYFYHSTNYYDLYRSKLEQDWDKKNPDSVEEQRNKSEGPEIRTSVLIKRLRPTEDKRGEEVFGTDIEMLTTCKHRNIVTLLGFCDEVNEKILVIEDASNGYLIDYLVNENDKDMSLLSWKNRLKICLDVAYGLKYLHHEMNNRKSVINGELTTFSIALDENLGAKIADFGLSMFIPPNESFVQMNSSCGNVLYIDPEYGETSKLSRESGVYTFGVILFESLCGKLASDEMFKESEYGLVYVARKCFLKGTLMEIMDPIIKEANKDSLDIFANIAYQCVAKAQAQRPTMEEVVEKLEIALEKIRCQENSENHKVPLRISLEDVQLATENFHKKHCVGKGGFGKIYIGKLPRSDHTIVAKLLDVKGGQREKQFQNELQVLVNYKHNNIISLVGYCAENDAKIIVSEYASRGSLDRYLDDASLTWVQRLNICIDVATALDFLHQGVGKQATVIHRDIKAANIILNDDWHAKLANFELSLISAIDKETDYAIDNVCGTKGYVDPVYLKSGFLTKESDIYSFGVVLFEILGGRSEYEIRKYDRVSLLSFIQHSFDKGKLHEVVFRRTRVQIEPEALNVFNAIAYRCLNEKREERPKAKEVLQQLKKALKLQMSNGDGTIDLPPKQENLFDHLRIRLSDIMSAFNSFNGYSVKGDKYCYYYTAELEHFDQEKFGSLKEKNISELPKKRSTVLIKRLHGEYKYGKKLLYNEIEMLTTCKHPNIVTLVGFCDEECEMILVFEIPLHENLHEYLLLKEKSTMLTWSKRLRICLDVAYGLKYLHYEKEDQKMISHRGIVSTAILVDENFRAKICDFSYSAFLLPNRNKFDLDMNYMHKLGYHLGPDDGCGTHKCRRETDVYSFGVLLFEIACGKFAGDEIYTRSNVDGLAHMARKCFRNGTLKNMIDHVIKDESLENGFTLYRGPSENSLDAFLKIAAACVDSTPEKRPTMKDVAEELEKALSYQENHKDHLRISLKDIQFVTENFDDKHCVGKGGFGKVYKGKLLEGDRIIVAKLLDVKGGQGEKQFQNELQILFKYKHNNIIGLVGYCSENDAKIIVYEYASRGSLDRYLNDTRLTWTTRLKICIDVATALDFLHSGIGKQATVIHRDIKAANILLNNDWNAKLADFGLSLISAIDKETDYAIERACGTPGYVDPLYLKSRLLTKESDVYSFGVVLFELMCGSTFLIHKKEDVFLPSFVKHSFDFEKVNEVVLKNIKTQIMPEALNVFYTIACQCLHDNREDRPTSQVVLQQLKKTLELQMSRGDGASSSSTNTSH